MLEFLKEEEFQLFKEVNSFEEIRSFSSVHIASAVVKIQIQKFENTKLKEALNRISITLAETTDQLGKSHSQVLT